MTSFKEWFKIQEMAINSAGQDGSPAQTAQATQQVAAKWMGNPLNAKAQGDLMRIGGQSKTALPNPLMNAASSAIKFGPHNLTTKTDAPQVGQAIQSSLGLPTVLKAPKPTQVRMMRSK